LQRGGSSAVGRGRVGRPDHAQQHCYHHAATVKPEAATAVVELVMMSRKMPETCSAVSKRQAVNLRNWCIWLVDSFEFRWYILLFNPLNAELNPICHLLALL
jgi:hypothetical protein